VVGHPRWGERGSVASAGVAVAVLGDVDIDLVEDEVGARAFKRGKDYARRNRVLQLRWDDDESLLTGRVLGHGEVYETTASFERDEAGLVFLEGGCSCPVAYNCKHVAAIVLAAADAERSMTPALAQARGLSHATATAGAPLRSVAATVPGARVAAEPSWEQALEDLLDPAPTDANVDAGRQGARPLAIELALQPDASGGTALLATIVRPGAKGWVNAGLSWSALDSRQMEQGNFMDGHVLVLRELYALHRARARVRALRSPTSWRPRSFDPDGPDDLDGPDGPDGKAIDLAGCGRPLWALLDEAERVGVRLLHARSTLGEIAPYRHAELCLDVTGAGPQGEPQRRLIDLVGSAGRGAVDDDDGGLVVAPRLRVAGLDSADGLDGVAGAEGSDGVEGGLVPVGFIGADGHGVVYARRDEVDADPDPAGWRLGLARLATAAPPSLRRLVGSGRVVEIPPSGRATFADEVWPRLRHIAPVMSSDGAFVPPAVSPPRLVLHADYGLGHALDLSWEWAYDVGGSERRIGVDRDPAEAGHRDPQAEQALVATLAPDAGLARFGLLTSIRGRSGAGAGDGARLTSRKQLTGLDTVRFTTEVLPLLADEPGVVVEVTGHPADFREVSDSLVIGLSTDAVPGETDWFDLGVTVTVDGRELAFTELFLALAMGETHLLLPDGAWFSLEKPELQALRALIDEARSLQDQQSESLRLSRYQAALWDDLRSIGVVHHQAEAWERQVGALLALEAEAEVEPEAGTEAPGEVVRTVDVPPAITAQLRPYQRDGFQWLAFLWEHGLGGILADDMGLGKTLQTLALICHARAVHDARQVPPDGEAVEAWAGLAPFLIIAPTSVVPNWAAEAARFAPDLSVVTVTDTLRRSGRTVEEVVAGADVVVVSYTLFRLEAEAYNGVDWSGLVLDEAQATKNHRSKVYGCIRRSPAPFKLAITGTPMENNLMELWSLLSITAPGLFPDPERFTEQYARPIERDGDVERLARLRRRIKPVVMRRTKEHVAADLPAKQEQVLEVELHPRHRRIYQTHLQRERQKVLGLIDDLDRNRMTILRSLTLLRQLSLHPALVAGKEGDEGDATGDGAAEAAAVPCAKLDTLVQQLDEVVAGGHRALVFSQFTGFLGLVRERLDREGVGYCYLDGRTRDRAAVLQRFKEGSDPVFLISLKAGGFGLNLTEADYCFLLDPWWNPATEAQAIDRTHRIGQTRNVIVYRLIARDTIEEKVMALKERKAQLFTGLLDDGNLFGGTLAADDIRALFAP
jgi:superfamily II DNA or RNA helicase